MSKIKLFVSLRVKKLLQGHPNISPLLSTEIDQCHIKLQDELEFMPETPVIRLSYVPHLLQLVTWFPIFLEMNGLNIWV